MIDFIIEFAEAVGSLVLCAVAFWYTLLAGIKALKWLDKQLQRVKTKRTRKVLTWACALVLFIAFQVLRFAF